MKTIFLRIGLVALIIILLVILISKLSNTEEKYLEVRSQFQPIMQTPTERNWHKKKLTSISLNSEMNDTLLNSMIVKSFNDTLYVADYADMKIKRFTSNGRYIDKFGENIGRGPSDLTQILDISFSDEALYVIDAETQLIKIFSKRTNKSTQAFRVDQFTFRVIVLNESKVTQSLSQDLFRTYNRHNKLHKIFGELTNNQFANIMSFGGTLLPSNKKNEFIYVPTYASYLLFYNTEGEFIKSIQTIDRLPFPKSEATNTGVRAPKPDLVVQSTTFNDEFIFIQYSRRPLPDSSNDQFNIHHSFVDVYTRDGENYIKSIILPQRSAGINTIGDSLYSINFSTRKIEAFLLPEIE
ncbi:MAG: hypothetical protein RIE52_10900 [Balneola sp.]|jgi:hypothetical protein